MRRNQKIGQYTVKGLTPGPAGEQAGDVRFSYDMNGVLDVDATIVATGKTATFTIERQMTGTSIAHFRAALEAQDQKLIVALREALLGRVLGLSQQGARH